MKKKLISSIGFVFVGLAGYIIGLISANPHQDSYFALFFAPIGLSVFVGLINFGCQILCEKEDERIRDSYAGLMKKPLTKKISGGYSLNPQDLYEAIEKLGYIEHNMEVELYDTHH